MASACEGLPMEGETLPSKRCLSELFNTGFLSDITLKIGDEEIKAHKSVLAAKSPWFKREIEKMAGKSDNLRITLTKESYLHRYIMRGVIGYLYNGEFPSPVPSMDTHGKEISSDFAQYHGGADLAVEYEINGLLEHCIKNYTQSYSAFVADDTDHLFFILLNARSTIRTGLPHTNITQAILFEEFKRRIEKLQVDGRNKEALRRIKQYPEWTTELFKRLGSENGQTKPTTQWKCSSCETVFHYSKKPEQNNMELPVCPCCSKTRKRGLKDVPLPELKKARVDS